VLLAELIYALTLSSSSLRGVEVGPQQVGASLFGPYVLGVELAPMLLLAALVGARHVAGQPDDGAGQPRDGAGAARDGAGAARDGAGAARDGAGAARDAGEGEAEA